MEQQFGMEQQFRNGTAIQKWNGNERNSSKETKSREFNYPTS